MIVALGLDKLVQFSSVAQSCPTFCNPMDGSMLGLPVLSITNSWNLLKFMSVESMMPSNHLILYQPLLLPPSIFPIIRVFSFFLSFFKFFKLLLFFFFTLQYCIGFAIHQHASTMGVHVFPIPNPPPTSLPIPSLWGPKHPVSCIEPGLAIRLLYDITHVLMPFSQIIPTLPLPQSPKDCSIHLCLFCCLSYRVVITIILNSIYMRSYTISMFFFLAYFTLYNRLQFHPPH